jgi:Flp pilus assembly pilin Flp
MKVLRLTTRTLNRIQRLANQFWNDERGLVQISQWMLLVVLLGIGMVAGAVSLRDQIVQEYGDVALALENLNQSYSYQIIITNDPLDPLDDVIVSSTSYTDTVGSLADLEDLDNMVVIPNGSPGNVDASLLDPAGAAPGGITFTAATTEGINLVQPIPGPNEIAVTGEAGGPP